MATLECWQQYVEKQAKALQTTPEKIREDLRESFSRYYSDVADGDGSLDEFNDFVIYLISVGEEQAEEFLNNLGLTLA